MTGRPGRPAPVSDEETVRLARRQFARRQWARRWLAWRGAVVALGLLVVLLVFAWVVYFSSLLAVTGVVVEGASGGHVEQVRRAADVPLGKPLARVDLDAIAARIEGLAPVRSADVSRSWPDEIRIAVVERTPVAVVVRGGVVRGLDQEGVLFRRYASPPPRLPVVHTGRHTRQDALAEGAKVIGALPDDLAARVDYIDVRTVDRISLALHDGRRVRWGSADDSREKARVLTVLLKHRGSAYDVTVPSRPTIRP